MCVCVCVCVCVCFKQMYTFKHRGMFAYIFYEYI